ncbi:glutathione S-transferase family protein [Paludibacterium sp. THUN1379]|uniref:glutathione S-transferase family protein n=1 Tax=Paludibacterium sp. THUN1379 TaxID=3112107 RepID=UPI00308FF7FE|nr:glutathione S-transferase family protein [Paludibacterium sp. THUN1379]
MKPALILHHYAASPYSEKIRLMLGQRQLPWLSVAMPPVLPKPDLMQLTHGYRRAPVLQIGADIYCDSALIADEIERRFPQPAQPTPHGRALAEVLSHWVDIELFWLTVRLVMGRHAEQIPQFMLDDRAAMHRQYDFSRQTLVADLPQVTAQLRPMLAWLDALLTGQSFFAGALPSGGDFGVYHPLWFLNNIGALNELAPQDGPLLAWFGRMTAFGHGEHAELSAAEAIHLAWSAQPEKAGGVAEPGWQVGMPVSVMPEGYPLEAVHGALCGLTAQRISLAVETPAGGHLHLHFPRLGYQLTQAD